VKSYAVQAQNKKTD